jgi:NADH-quinone oxidoreductase subunit J
MMLDIDHKTLREGFGRYLAAGSAVGALVLLELYMVFKAKGTELATTTAKAMAEDIPNTLALGRVLYTDYLYPFELAAMLLLVAMVAAITLTKRPRRSTKYQEPSIQVEVKATDRLKILKMPAEKAE